MKEAKCKVVHIVYYSLCKKEGENKKKLLCSTGNYIQYLVITYNGKESEKEYIYINNFAVYQKLHNL